MLRSRCFYIELCLTALNTIHGSDIILTAGECLNQIFISMIRQLSSEELQLSVSCNYLRFCLSSAVSGERAASGEGWAAQRDSGLEGTRRLSQQQPHWIRDQILWEGTVASPFFFGKALQLCSEPVQPHQTGLQLIDHSVRCSIRRWSLSQEYMS